jgi:hypothetical protein
MGKQGRPIFGIVFVKQNTSLSITQQTRQSCLAFKKRASTQILAIMLDQIKRVDYHSVRSLPSAQLVEYRQTVWPHHDGAPPIVKFLALIRCAAVAMAYRRTVEQRRYRERFELSEGALRQNIRTNRRQA